MFPVRGGSKKFEDWGVKNVRTGGVTNLGVISAGGASTPSHAMHNCGI